MKALRIAVRVLVFSSLAVLCMSAQTAEQSVVRLARPAKQEQKYSWVRPPVSALVEAAQRGYEGERSPSIKLYENMRAVCTSEVGAILLTTPTLLAEAAGNERKKKSEPPLTAAEVLGFRQTAQLEILYGSHQELDTIEVEVKQKGRTYKADDFTQNPARRVKCGSEDSLRSVWLHSVVVTYRGKRPLPLKGRATVIVHRTGKLRYEIPVQFEGPR